MFFSTACPLQVEIVLFTELNITFFHISTTLAAYASMWIYLCLWSWLILAPGLNNDCMKRSRKAGTRICEGNEWFIRAWELQEVTKNTVFASDIPCTERDMMHSPREFYEETQTFDRKEGGKWGKKEKSRVGIERKTRVTNYIAKVCYQNPHQKEPVRSVKCPLKSAYNKLQTGWVFSLFFISSI